MVKYPKMKKGLKILGIDEAGRGAVLGPMVIAAILVRSSRLTLLKNLGIKSSKKLIAKKRKKLYLALQELDSKIEKVVVLPTEINQKNLNQISVEKTAFFIKKLKPDIALLDAPTRGRGLIRYQKKVWEKLPKKIKLEIRAENKADENHLPVAAASIIAKVTRDQIIKKLHQKFGDFGSGYPSDPKTKKFLKKYFQKHQNFPFIARKKWQTVKAFFSSSEKSQ